MFTQLPRVVNLGNPINMTAPLNRGLFFCSRFFPGGPKSLQSMRNLVRRKDLPTILGTVLRPWSSRMLKGGGVRNQSDGSSYLRYPYQLNNFTTRLTGTVIYTPEIIGNDYRIINQNNGGGTYPFLLRTSTTSKLEIFNSYGGAAGGYQGATTLQIHKTYQLGFTIGAAGVCLYVNGILDGTTTYNGTTMSPYVRLTVGADLGSGGMAGIVDEVRLYNRELSGNEMRGLFEAARKGYQQETNWLDRPRLLNSVTAAVDDSQALWHGQGSF